MPVVESLPSQLSTESIPSISEPVPATMQAAVYIGDSRVEVQSVSTPHPLAGEILIRVESCGICHTDLKKIEYNLLAPPRIYGHETAGVIAAVGERVEKFRVGQRVVVFHHIPCGDCFYCERRLYAQCAIYKKVGVTAGFEAAGGGFSQYVRVLPWIVERGVELIPDEVSFDQACWVEPVNTCLKGVRLIEVQRGDVVAVLGQGPIGLIFTLLAQRAGAGVFATDTMQSRVDLSRSFGADSYDARQPGLEDAVHSATLRRGADAVILATNAPGLVEQALRISRPGAKILLFAQTSAKERIECSGADICVGERMLFGSYSADVDLQSESARLVFSGELPLEELISHRFPLRQIDEGITVAQHPKGESLKVVVHPQEQT